MNVSLEKLESDKTLPLISLGTPTWSPITHLPCAIGERLTLGIYIPAMFCRLVLVVVLHAPPVLSTPSFGGLTRGGPYGFVSADRYSIPFGAGYLNLRNKTYDGRTPQYSGGRFVLFGYESNLVPLAPLVNPQSQGL